MVWPDSVSCFYRVCWIILNAVCDSHTVHLGDTALWASLIPGDREYGGIPWKGLTTGVTWRCLWVLGVGWG